MAELLAELARRLVDEPDAVHVEQLDGDDGSLIFRLHVAEGDGWRIAHRHADPITTPQAVESILQR